MISAEFKNGKAYIYKKESAITSQARYKCFIYSDDGKECGSFEILIEDKNDYKDIITSKMVQQSYKCYN